MNANSANAKPTVLVFIHYYLPGHKSGGPLKTLANLIDTTHNEFDYLVITRDRDLGDQQAYAGIDKEGWNSVGAARVRYIASGLQGVRQIAQIIKDTTFDVLYLNSFFAVSFGLLPQWLNRGAKRPVVLGPRGQFSEGAYALKALKKKLFVKMFKLVGAHKAVTWQASTQHERDDIYRVMGRKVSVIDAEDIASRQYATQLVSKEPECLKAVFLSRISPKKNLDYALRVLQKIDFPMTFDIYGPAEDEAYWGQCQALIAQLPSNITVSAKGMLAAEAVVETLSRYDVFFFPTKGENYGHVIAEALCAGLPLVLADTTPWRNLASDGIGWDLPLSDSKGFAQSLETLYNTDPQSYSTLRKRVLDWAQDRFEKDDAVEANCRMFNTVLTHRGNHVGKE